MTLQSNPIFYQYPTYPESYEDPLILLYFIHDDPLPSQEKSVLPSPIHNPLLDQDHDIHSIPSNDLIQNQEKSTNSNDPIQNPKKNANSNDPIPSQDQSFPSSPCHNPPNPPEDPTIHSYSTHDPNPPQDPTTPIKASHEPFIYQMGSSTFI